jgi:alkylation response protein AidB-like acyl-CoA dehydrogenase
MPADPTTVTDPNSPAFQILCQELAERSCALDADGHWPAEQLRLCAEAGAIGWFVPKEHGGQGWTEADCVHAYIKLSAACLATTFVLTQPIGMARRLAACRNPALRRRLLPDLLAGRTYGAIGISQLTTSRRHFDQPVLLARERADGFELDGYIPWVTGAQAARAIVTGASLEDGRQILLALPTDVGGVRAEPPLRLTALSSTHTGTVRCERAHVGRDWLLAGPAEDVMASIGGAGTGGLQTSALAVGLASAAINFLTDEAQQRSDLLVPLGGLSADLRNVENDLLQLALGESVCTLQELRVRANSLVLRATQAALAAAKGSGYVVGHPASRWCREALFFLVWSCPQPVMAANLCELAGLSD